MAKFRKKPIIVEAEQWFPGKRIVGVFGETPDIKMSDGSTFPAAAMVTTIHDQHTRIVSGDWVITEPDGVHHYPCKPDIFAATYEPVS